MKIKKILLVLAILFLGLAPTMNVALAVDREAACNGKSPGDSCEYDYPEEAKGSCCKIYYNSVGENKGLFCDYRVNYAACCGKNQGDACSFFFIDTREGSGNKGIEKGEGTCKLDTAINNTIGLLVCEVPSISSNGSSLANSTGSNTFTATVKATGKTVTLTKNPDGTYTDSSTGTKYTAAQLTNITAVIAVGGANTTIEFVNPLKFDTFEEVLTSLLTYLRGIIVTISIIFIVIGAVLYITSAGDEERIKTAKKAITASLVGLAIGIAAPSFLREISIILGWGEDLPPEVEGATPIAEIALNALNFLLGIVGILAIIMLVVGGIMYLTSATSTVGTGGDQKKVSTAKTVVKYAIIGIIVALASLVLVKQIANFFT